MKNFAKGSFTALVIKDIAGFQDLPGSGDRGLCDNFRLCLDIVNNDSIIEKL